QPNTPRTCAESACGAEYGRSWPAGTHTGIEIRGSSAAVPAIGHLRPRRCGSVPLDVGQLGRRRPNRVSVMMIVRRCDARPEFRGQPCENVTTGPLPQPLCKSAFHLLFRSCSREYLAFLLAYVLLFACLVSGLSDLNLRRCKETIRTITGRCLEQTKIYLWITEEPLTLRRTR